MAEKVQIQFNKSMTTDKRNANFAYLRKNMLNESTPGLYPSKDYVLESPQGSPVLSSWDLVDVVGSDRSGSGGQTFRIKAIYHDNAGNIQFFNLGSGSVSNTQITGQDVVATAFGTDGIYVLTDDDNVYRPNNTSSSTSLIGTLDQSVSVDVGGFDGLRYWWAGNNGIWRQLPGEDGFQVMTTIGFNIEKMDFYRDYMVLFREQDGPDIYIYFWDKQNTTVFSKRVIIKNATLLAGGVVDGVLMCVYSVGDTTNAKEYEGKIVVSAFDGEGFRELNSIKAGRENVEIPGNEINGVSMDTGNQVMVFAVDNNDRETKNPDLYNNFVYKVRNNGMIEVEALPPTNGTRNYASIAKVFYSFNLFGVGASGANIPKIYTNDDSSRDWDNYTDYNNTEYITQFLNNPFNYHRLEGLSVTFEKLFKNTAGTGGEELLEVYYRTSERQSFTLLGTITPTKVIANVDTRLDPAVAGAVPVLMQTYQFTKCDDGTTLPEYNEIQFKFKSKHGFSVIGAWYEYSYITRNILN